MTGLFAVLDTAARHARWVLVSGLVVALLLPAITLVFKPLIPLLIALLLLAASFRVGPDQAFGALQSLHRSIGLALVLQCLVPVALLLCIVPLGLGGIYVIALLLVASAAPITGSPNLVLMLGGDPAPTLRQLILGTAILPLTAIPLFWWLPDIGNIAGILVAVFKLLLVIGVATGAGFILRKRWYPTLTQPAESAVDGLSAILMALVVLGLMSAMGQALREEPLVLVRMLLFACVVNVGFQVLGFTLYRWVCGKTQRPEATPDAILNVTANATPDATRAEKESAGTAGSCNHAEAVSTGVISGNRNIALFLTALPATVVEPLLLFIGCYQIPMYLTPLLMRRFYRR